MKFISLFSGIGGLDLGLEWAGMTCVAQVERDEYCRKVLAKHWPDVPKFEDVKDVGKHNLPAADLIAGGFPCQPHSVAGKRRGAADDRNLWPEYLRIITELRPTWVLAENVPGIITSYLDTVLSDLESKAYTAVTFDIPALAFDAPHRRHRIFVVGYTASEQKHTEYEKPGGFGEQSRRTMATWRKAARQAHRETGHNSSGRYGPIVAHTEQERRDRQSWGRARTQPANGYAQMEGKGGHAWPVESDVGRVAHGIPNRVERLRGLGNAVVPQVAEFLGHYIMEAHYGRHKKT